MAGNIIAAIATTNAIIAGVCVLQSFKVLKKELQSTKTVFLSRRPERVFNNESSARPNQDCSVCGVAQIVLKADTNKLTLQSLVKDVLQDTLNYSEEVSILTKDLIYDPDFDDNLEKTMQDLNIQNGTFLTIIDDDENENGLSRINLNIIIEHFDAEDETHFKAIEAIEIPYKTKAAPMPEADIIVPAAPEVNGTTEKRKRPADDDAREDEPNKKQRSFQPSDADVLIINDGDEIVID